MADQLYDELERLSRHNLWLMRRVHYQDSVMRDHAATEEWREAEAADLRAQVKASQSQLEEMQDELLEARIEAEVYQKEMAMAQGQRDEARVALATVMASLASKARSVHP